MTNIHLTQEDCKDYIPHRYENLMIDSIDIYKDEKDNIGDFKLTITKDDPLGRYIFTQETQPDYKTFLSTVSTEIFALASIVSVDKIPPGHLAFFASVSNFVKEKDHILGQEVIGKVQKIKAKANFFLFGGKLFNSQNQLISSGEMLASFIDVSNGFPQIADEDKKTVNFPAANINFNPASLNKTKSKTMFLSDKINYFNPENNECVSEYTFHDDHPLTKGHFPSNPVMMGIMQWLMAEDASLYVATELQKQGITGKYFILCDADILRQNGIVTTEIKDLKIEVNFSDNPASRNHTEIVATKRISFRDMVYKNTTLYAYLKNVRIER
jgi:3-hydroxymyristoyl/3-hydroxydecanoyl-(acyl carrier protein) dehydratase